MKKYILLLCAIAFVFQACINDILDENPKGSLTMSQFYKTNNDLEMGMAGIALQFNGAFNQTWGAMYGGDDITSKNTGNKVNFSELDRFILNGSNARISNWWNYFYSTVKSSNALINGYEGATEATEKQRDNAAGLAFFYRAASYFFLTRTWGEIPVNTDGNINKDRPNAKVEDVYSMIVSDLQKAETMLPTTWTGVRVQEGVNIFPTQGSAKALLANVYLTMAGWPLKQTDKYALAAAKAKEVIDNKATYGYQLEDIKQLWRKRFTPETVFGCYYNVNISGWSWENGSQMGPKAFGCEEEGDWEDGYGELAFYNNFPEGPRKDETYQKEYFKKDENGNTTVVDYTQTNRQHPFFLKYRYDNFDWEKHQSTNWWGSATIPIIRYAEVLLTYAEAQAMAADPDPDAYAAVNEVRKRAGLDDLPAGLSKTGFREAVIAERGWEFAGPEPACRWFDLLRTETLAKANSTRDAAEIAIDPANMPDDNTHKNYWLPIPANN